LNSYIMHKYFIGRWLTLKMSLCSTKIYINLPTKILFILITSKDNHFVEAYRNIYVMYNIIYFNITYIRRIRKNVFFFFHWHRHMLVCTNQSYSFFVKNVFLQIELLEISPRRSPSPQFRSTFTQITQRKLDIYLFFLHAKIVCTVSHSSLNRDACDFSGLIAHILINKNACAVARAVSLRLIC